MMGFAVRPTSFATVLLLGLLFSKQFAFAGSSTGKLEARTVSERLAQGRLSPSPFGEHTDISNDACSALINWPGPVIDLRSIHKLSDECVKSLSRWKGSNADESALDPSGLEALNVAQAMDLSGWVGHRARHRYVLRLNGLKRVSAEVIHALHSHSGYRFHRIELNGLIELDGELAAAFATLPVNVLELGGLQQIEDDAFAELAASKAYSLRIGEIGEISASFASAIRQFQGKSLTLLGVTSIAEEADTQLANVARGKLLFDSFPIDIELAERLPNLFRIQQLARLSPVLARKLLPDSKPSVFERTLDLSNLKSLSPEVAKVIVSWQPENAMEIGWMIGRLDLSGLDRVSPAVAMILASWKGEHLNLGGIASLDRQVADALAGCSARIVDLSGLREISLPAAHALGKRSFRGLALNGLQTLGKETADALLSNRAEPPHLNGIVDLSADVAKRFVASKHDLPPLNGVTRINRETARVLASGKGDSLSLRGLESLSPVVAKELIAWNGKKLIVGSKESMSPATLRSLAQWHGALLFLPTIQVLSREQAMAICTWKTERQAYPVLNLDNFLYASDDTLLALDAWDGIVQSKSYWFVTRTQQLESEQ